MNRHLASDIVDAIKSEGLSDLIVDLSDIAISAGTNSEFLDSVPIIGTLRALWKASVSVRDIVFLSQVRRFLMEVARVTPPERQEFVAQLERNGELDRFGAAVLLLIEKADEIEKPAIVGRLLAAHMRGNIRDYAVAMRLAWIVNRCHVPDLLTLKSFTPGVQRDKAVADSLCAVGLLYGTGFDGGVWGNPGSGGIPYEMSDYATWLVKYGLAQHSA